MTARIPMVGDPKPFDREELGRSLREAVPRMHQDARAMLEEAEASGDKSRIREAKALLKKTQGLVDRMGGAG